MPHARAFFRGPLIRCAALIPVPPARVSNPRSSSATYQAWAAIIGLLPAALILILGPRLPFGNIALAASISAGFALLGWLLGAVNASGALTGFGVAFVLTATGGLR